MPDSHVTIVLLTGESRRVPMSDVRYAGEEAGAQAAMRPTSPGVWEDPEDFLRRHSGPATTEPTPDAARSDAAPVPEGKKRMQSAGRLGRSWNH